MRYLVCPPLTSWNDVSASTHKHQSREVSVHQPQLMTIWEAYWAPDGRHCLVLISTEAANQQPIDRQQLNWRLDYGLAPADMLNETDYNGVVYCFHLKQGSVSVGDIAGPLFWTHRAEFHLWSPWNVGDFPLLTLLLPYKPLRWTWENAALLDF